MAANKWYVLTGGPSSGKTTLIDDFSKRGYKTVQEAARTWIDQELVSGKTIEEIRADEEKFQHDIVKLKVDIESDLPKTKTIFFDRGMHDSEAYLKHYDFPISSQLQKIFDNAAYQKVFLLEMLPVFEKDYARTEDEAFANKITELLEATYKDAGFEVVRVPVLPLPERAQFILDHIDD